MTEIERAEAEIQRARDQDAFRAHETSGGTVMLIATGDPNHPYVPVALARYLQDAWVVGRLAPDETDERHRWRAGIAVLVTSLHFNATAGWWVLERGGYRTVTPHDLFDLARSTETEGPWINLAARRPLTR